ncbi:major capsid protein [Ilyobacter sp.]|uniref:major capsid protein n=1 Tax=Ilyobacter sp. TaxID=3100343 RepID=UPI00356895E0
MYDLKTLIAATKQTKKPNMFLWNLLISKSVDEMTSKFEVHTKKARRKMAPFVGKYINGQLIKKDGFSIMEIEPGLLKPFTIAHAEDMLKQQFGQTVYGDSVSSEEMAEGQMAKELAELTDTIARREMWLLSKLITTGSMPIDGEGVSRAITYGSDEGNFETLSGTELWTDAASDPIAYLKEKQLEILKATGINIDSIIMTPEASSAFQSNENVTAKLKYTTADVMRIEPRSLGDGAKYIGTIPELELDIYSYVDWVENPATEADESLLPAGGIVGVKSKSFEVHYGAIAQKSEGGKGVFVGDRIPKVWSPEGADYDCLRLASAPAIVPDDADGWFYSKVV